MQNLISKYDNKGEFYFSNKDILNLVCNAPNKSGGVYLVYNTSKSKESLIYIGCSGWVNQDGVFHSRKGGLFDRIVNGKQFEEKRSKSWPIKMKTDKIEQLRVNWYVTFDVLHKDIPTYVESLILQQFFNLNKCLPIWNNKF